ILLLFFFLWYGSRHHLLSFPTRRSSDLRARSRVPEAACTLGTRPECVKPSQALRCSTLLGDTLPRGGKRMMEKAARRWYSDSRRSEEHTSELQSLAYLVCRLLLEKKKLH